MSISAMVIALLSTPLHAQQADETDNNKQENSAVLVPPPFILKPTETPETVSVEVSEDDIDVELEAELEQLEQLEQLSDPTELLKTFALKKPLIELPTPKADRLAVAEKIVARLFPVGTSERALRSTLNNMIIPMIDRTLDLTVNEAIELFGVPEDLIPEDQEENNERKIGDLIKENDPDFREKMDTLFDVYPEIVGLTSEPIEPALAGAMARDYARKYDLQQLNDLNLFFSSPTGALFANDFMLSTASIDMVQTALKEFPAIAENSEKIQEVSKRLEDVFKSEPVVIEEKECEDCNNDEADEESIGIEKEDPLSADFGYEPWYDTENWDSATRDNVSQLEDTYNELAKLSEEAYSQYSDAFDTAVIESREKYIAEGWEREEENSAE